MEEYYLFLDESKSIGELKYFCLAGCIIKKDEYVNDIIPKVNLLKQRIFGKTDIVLHEKEIRDAKGNFNCLANKDTRELFWTGIHKIFAESDIVIIGSSVSTNIKDSIYKSDNLNSDCHIALQIVLENFAHFLEKKNAKGSVLIESTDAKADKKLANLYHSIVLTGTLFLERNVYQEHLTTISFYIKQDNNVGLQLADFIPNPINRKNSGKSQKLYSLHDIIMDKLYDGEVNLKERFGLKVIE